MSKQIKKHKIDFPKNVENAMINFNGFEVEVNKSLSLAQEQTLIQMYLDAYFGEGDFATYKSDDKEIPFSGAFGCDVDYVEAEKVFDLVLLDIATSIDFSLKKFFVGEENRILDYVEEYEVMDDIKSKISNLGKIKGRIDKIVQIRTQEKYSMNGLLKQLMKSVEDLDFEKLKDLGAQLKELQEDVKDSPISTLMDKGNKVKGT